MHFLGLRCSKVTTAENSSRNLEYMKRFQRSSGLALGLCSLTCSASQLLEDFAEAPTLNIWMMCYAVQTHFGQLFDGVRCSQRS